MDPLLFKAAFLSACGEMGLTTEETVALARSLTEATRKAAEDLRKDADIAQTLMSLGRLGSSAVGSVGQAVGGLSTAAKWMLGLGLGVPAAGGLALGAGIPAATDADSDDVDAIKTRELIREYRDQAARLNNTRRVYRLPR